MTPMVANETNLSERECKAFQKLIYDLAGISLAYTKQIMVQGRLAKRLRALDLASSALKVTTLPIAWLRQEVFW